MKKLQRSRSNKVFFGVCGGLAEYLGLDPVAVRLVFVLITLFGGMGVVAYIIGVIIIPENTEQDISASPSESATSQDMSATPAKTEKQRDKSGEIIGIVLVTFGVFFLLRKLPFLDHYFDWISFHFWSLLLPTVLLLLGVSLIMRSRNK